MEPIQYAIITREDEIEEYIYGHKFQTGLNICPHTEFFHIYDTKAIPKRLPIYLNDTYIRFVTFCHDTKFLYPNPANPYFTIKADKIILSERMPLSIYITADMVKENYACLQHIPPEKRTYQMYIDAIQQGCYYWLTKLSQQTTEACILAVQADYRALLVIKHITPEIAYKAYLTAKKDIYYNTDICPWKLLLHTIPSLQEIAKQFPLE